LKLASGDEKINFRIDAKLLSKEVVIDGNKVQVYGLRSFHVNPRNKGIGKEALKGMESVAKKDGKHCIVAFCDPGVLGFYKDSGWSVCGIYEGRNIICSIPAKEILVNERW
jgi:predicted N-acetyltransferase YhbS